MDCKANTYAYKRHYNAFCAKRGILRYRGTVQNQNLDLHKVHHLIGLSQNINYEDLREKLGLPETVSPGILAVQVEFWYFPIRDFIQEWEEIELNLQIADEFVKENSATGAPPASKEKAAAAPKEGGEKDGANANPPAAGFQNKEVVPGQDGVDNEGKPKVEKTVMLTLRQKKGDKSSAKPDEDDDAGAGDAPAGGEGEKKG